MAASAPPVRQPATTPLESSFFPRYCARVISQRLWRHRIPRTHSLDTAFRARKDSSYQPEVSGTAPAGSAHLSGTLTELLSDWQLLECLSFWTHWSVVAHLSESSVSTYLFCGEIRSIFTLDMNSPNMAPNPVPITPDMAVFPAHDSMAACIWIGLAKLVVDWPNGGLTYLIIICSCICSGDTPAFCAPPSPDPPSPLIDMLQGC